MPVNRDTTHSILSVLFICLLIALSFWILRPFLVSIVWGTIIVVASWPILERLQKQFGMGRGLAVTLMTATLLLILVVPLTLAIVTIARNSHQIGERLTQLKGTLSDCRPLRAKGLTKVRGVCGKHRCNNNQVSADGHLCHCPLRQRRKLPGRAFSLLSTPGRTARGGRSCSCGEGGTRR